MGYKIAGSGTFADDFLVSARTEIQRLNFGQGPAFRIPIIGNFSPLRPAFESGAFETQIQQLISTAEGLNLGIEPYFAAGPANGRLRSTLYGKAGWKMNAARSFADSTETVYINQWRFSVGWALDAYVVEGSDGTPNSLPIQLTVEPVYTVISDRDYGRAFGRAYPGNITSLELTGIVPLGSGMGLLAQATAAEWVSPTWRVGIIFFKQPSKTTETQTGGPALPPPTPVNPNPAGENPTATPSDPNKPPATNQTVSQTP